MAESDRWEEVLGCDDVYPGYDVCNQFRVDCLEDCLCDDEASCLDSLSRRATWTGHGDLYRG